MEEINITIENEDIEQQTFSIPETDEEFLESVKDFIPEPVYKKPSVTVDNVIFSKDLRYILLIKRANEPYKDYYALPGGFAEENESLEDAAKRELKEETNIDIPTMKLIGVYSKPNRDPRGWTISIAYWNVIDKRAYAPKAGDDAKSLEWVDVAKINNLDLAFDHKTIIVDAYEKAFIDKK